MKTLSEYIKEEIAATPGNTIGMGNPMPAGVAGEIGSEPIPTAKVKKQKSKKFKSLKESLLDDEESLIDNKTELIEQFLKDNYEIEGKYYIDGNIVNAPGARVKFINRSNNAYSLTDGLFEFGEVYSFNCSKTSIKSLKGAPKRVCDFYCKSCPELTNLEGAPQYIAEFFSCESCKYLTSLKGLPSVINGELDCSHCKSLKSLRGGPKEVHGKLDCLYCDKLKNLNYLPKIKGNFYCSEELMDSNKDIIEKQVRGEVKNGYGRIQTDF